MISHEHRCIFVHIPRTAGSSIEDWISGTDWWNVDPSTKHLTAHQARETYSEFWDDYFKFSFVRDPWDRMLSCLHFAHFGVSWSDGSLDFSGYETLFGAPVTLEIDYRFNDRAAVLRDEHIARSVYGNLLDEPLDFVGRFEHLDADTSFIAEALGIRAPFNSRLKQSTSRPSTSNAYDQRSNEWILRTFDADFERFGYERRTV